MVGDSLPLSLRPLDAPRLCPMPCSVWAVPVGAPPFQLPHLLQCWAEGHPPSQGQSDPGVKFRPGPKRRRGRLPPGSAPSRGWRRTLKRATCRKL